MIVVPIGSYFLTVNTVFNGKYDQQPTLVLFADFFSRQRVFCWRICRHLGQRCADKLHCGGHEGRSGEYRWQKARQQEEYLMHRKYVRHAPAGTYGTRPMHAMDTRTEHASHKSKTIISRTKVLTKSRMLLRRCHHNFVLYFAAITRSLEPAVSICNNKKLVIHDMVAASTQDVSFIVFGFWYGPFNETPAESYRQN